MNLTKLFGTSLFLVAIAGCTTVQETPEVTNSKSLYEPQAVLENGRVKTLDNFPSLVSDHRSYGVGDGVTVLIVEEASSTTAADTQTSKSLDVSARLSDTSRVEFGNLDIENGSRGAGAISREGRLVATVSATVQQVLTTGEMLIFGEQKIEFNNETQYIRVAGRIRPEDINGNNVVLSSRISQAEITYKGDGLLGSRQKPGVITNMFNWLF